MPLRLLLIRHGLSSFNRENRIQGRNDLSTLTEEGLLQAKKAGESLKNIELQAIYTSPLQRASDTACEIAKTRIKNIEPILENDLLEVDLSPWSGLTINEVKEKYPDSYRIWAKNPEALKIVREDGSSYQPIKDLFSQAERLLTKIIATHKPEKNETVLCVGHNAILRCIILKLLNKPQEGFRRIKLDNSSISILNINAAKYNHLEVQIESLNSTAHLENQFPLKGSNARIFLVRHGETNWNKEGRFQGQIDIPLNEAGKKQAFYAGKLLEKINFQKAFSSPMSRPMETAKIILDNRPDIKIEQQNDLIEIGHGLWEGKLESEIRSSWPELLNAWQKTPEKVQMPEGENINEVSIRAKKCWKKICQSLSSQETALVVAHDAVNKTILCDLLGLSTADIWKVKQGNGGITIIDIIDDIDQPDIVMCLNYTSHLGGVIDNTAQGAL